VKNASCCGVIHVAVGKIACCCGGGKYAVVGSYACYVGGMPAVVEEKCLALAGKKGRICGRGMHAVLL
jgi:hypothetical protein